MVEQAIQSAINQLEKRSQEERQEINRTVYSGDVMQDVTSK